MNPSNPNISPEEDIRDLPERWRKLEEILKAKFDKKITLESVLFLVGVHELGTGPRAFTKEEKTDLMHIAICAILSRSGYYELDFLDQEGWPHWKLVKELPFANVFSQEVFIKSHIVDYFSEIFDLD